MSDLIGHDPDRGETGRCVVPAPGSGPRPDLRLVFAQGLIVLLLLGLRACHCPSEADAAQLVYPLCVAAGCLWCWSIWSWRRMTGRLFDFYMVFFLATAVFNSGQAVLEIFHLNSKGLLAGHFSQETLVETLYVVLLGLAGLHFGALVAAARHAARHGGRPSPATADQALNLACLRRVALAMLIVAGPFSVLVLKDCVSVVLASGYMGLYQQEVNIGMNNLPQLLSQILIRPAGLFLFTAGQRWWGVRLLALAVVVVYAAVNFFLGYRYASAMPLLALAWLWHHRVRPIPVGLLAAAATLVVVVLFPLIRVSRENSGERRSLENVWQAFGSVENPAVAAISEMGGSMETISHTIEIVPGNHAYERGASYAYAALTLFPNFFWSIHPTVARGIPTYWLINIVDPWTARHGGSLGYSILAEAYLNFGWIGTPLVLILMGFCYAAFVLWASSSSVPARTALVACVACTITLYAREDAASVIREMVWYAVLPYLLVTWLTRRQQARAEAAAERPVPRPRTFVPGGVS